MSEPRAILHVDMDAFFASVEQLDEPSIRGKPVLVGHDGPRGIVAAASYEAREFGCHSAQPMAIALRRCPHAVVRPGRMSRYAELSRMVFDLFETVTPLVQPLSVDEAFLDVTGSVALLGSPVEIARDLRRRIHTTTGLTASVGVAPNKFLAKLVSDWDKPDGLTVITAEEAVTRLAERPVREMWGVGAVTERELHRLGIRTFGDLQRLDVNEAEHRFGRGGPRLVRLARGEDTREVISDGSGKQIGQEQTFGADLEDPETVRAILLRQVENVAGRLRRQKRRGRTVSLKIRFGAFQTISRSHSLSAATDVTEVIWHEAKSLFETWAHSSFRPVRLIGVSVSNLDQEEGRQLDLFARPSSQLDEATDAIRARFGAAAIQRGVPRGGGR